ncbi:PAS domain-containing hybrid sensor histidine kinase/response regulator [Rhodoflexus caldus]|uniref:PAS domain-containing hybrid sensor histidine kinase/response regulator n=1 Tax=Rhodoflexus caldus TaxID=2891236 RepID=UPI002029E368|nr:PAS domain S-box protein [Rhodoflexus caldus]
MPELDDIAVDKEISEIRLLPLVLIMMLWGLQMLPYQADLLLFDRELLLWITFLTLSLSALTLLPSLRQSAKLRRNLLMAYQAVLLPMLAQQLFAHEYHPLFLLIYLFGASIIAFIARYSRLRLSAVLAYATGIVALHPMIEAMLNEQLMLTWQTALILTIIWNGAMFAINTKVRERQLSQTLQYLQTIRENTQKQKEYAEQLYIERLHLQNIVDNVDVFVALVDKNGIVIQINRPFLDYIGSHGVSTDLIGKPITSIAVSEERRRVVEESIQTALQGQIVTGELYNDESDKYLVLRYCPIKDRSTGEIYGVGIYYRDITQAHKAQQQLKYAGKQLKAILDSIDQNVYLTDKHGRIINVNKRAQEGNLGLNPAPPVGELLLNNIKEAENRESYLRHHKEALQGKITSVEYYIAPIKQWMQVKYMPAYDQAGDIFGVIIVVADISLNKRKEEELLDALAKNKAAQAQLAARETMYRQLLNASTDQIALKDIHSQYLWTNHRFKEFYGEVPANDSESQEKELAEDREVLLKKELVTYEYWVRNQYSENHLLRTIKAPIWNQEGKIDKIAVFSTDITEQNERIQALEGLIKAYQELSEQEQTKARELSESQATIQLLAENTSELIALAHANGYLTYVSPSAKKLTGFAPEEMIGHTWADFFHQDDLIKIQEAAESLRQTQAEHTLTHRIRTRSGRYIWLETIWKYILDEKDTVVAIQSSSRDITERMAAEQAVQALATRYQTLFNASYDAILILKTNPLKPTDLTVVEANTSAYELLGYSTEELRELNILEIENKISWQELRRRIKTFTNRREILLETRICNKAGQWLWVEIAAIPLPIGEEEYLQLTIRDISPRKQAEEAMKAKAIAEKSLEFKSNFLAKMSHEIRTPMNGLQGMTYLLLGTSLDERQKKIVDSIQNSTKGLLAILNDILDLSKLEAGKLTLELAPMDLRRCIGEVQDLFDAVALEKKLTLSYWVSDNVPALIVSDYNRLRQIINNLVSNAIKFTDAGTVTVTAELSEAFEEYDILKITVRDTGIGIDEASFEQLFDKFYQGKQRAAGGTGLGLAICKELVELLGGEIGLQSKLNHGSEFWFTFKAWHVQAHPPEPEPTAKQYTYRAIKPIHVLFAEDITVNQEVTKWMLEEIGVRVTTVSNGLEAYESAKSAPYDLILMDINMPVMDGITAMQHIKTALSPCPPIVGMSANAMAGDTERFMAQGLDAYLTKPITPEALYEMLYRFLPESLERTAITAQENQAEQVTTDMPLMNPSVIAHIKKLAGNHSGMLQGLLESFILDIGQIREKISHTYLHGNHTEMVKVLHTLKGLSGTIGASRLFDYSNALYGQASAVPQSVSSEQLEQLFQLMDATCEAVRSEHFSQVLTK